MQIAVFSTREEFDAYAADRIASLVSDKPEAVLGLATGSTPIGIYEKLVQKHRSEGLSFRKVTTFNLDEYVGLQPEHEQSYDYYMRHHLFNHIDIPKSQTNLPNGAAPDLHAECVRYEQMLAERPIDLQILGIGHNGHIAFNEPGPELQGATHSVELKAETRNANARFFASLDEVPKYALTMGVGSILKAKRILLAVRGADKADIIYEALAGPITTYVPASLLQTHADVTVVLDREAAKKLERLIDKGRLTPR